MGKVWAFLWWLFSFWALKDIFLRWLGNVGFHPASSRGIVGHLVSSNEQPESKLACFLSSLAEDKKECYSLDFKGDSEVKVHIGGVGFTLIHGTGVEASFGEFLEVVASSEIKFHKSMEVYLRGEDSCQHMEAFADALRTSRTRLEMLQLTGWVGCPVLFTKFISKMLLENDVFEELYLHILQLSEEIGKDLVAEFMGNIAVPHCLRILKSFAMRVDKLDGEGMEQLMKPFQDPLSVLERLHIFDVTSDVQLEHISGMLASSTSLRELYIYKRGIEEDSFTRGFRSLAIALCSNQSLQDLTLHDLNGEELKVLLDPLIPKNNNLQCNTSLTKLCLDSLIVGKEGIATLVDMLCTNSSLLELELEDLSLEVEQGVENVLAILEALKSNKFLKKVSFYMCEAVGGYKVLGGMMDLLLENHNIEDINLGGTALKRSGDADYVSSALSKRMKMKFLGDIHSMARDHPTSGRVFLCGEPYAGKTRLHMSMKQLEEFQQKDGIATQSRMRRKLCTVLNKSHMPQVPTEDTPLERTHGIEVESVLCDSIGITIWDMAGQSDYHSFHELVMPNHSADGSSSMFLLMCNPMQQSNLSERRFPSDIKKELETWLRFIASNTRRSFSYRPHVSIVMTHLDYWMDDYAFADCIEDVVAKLKSQFQEVLEFDEDKSIFKVDGRSVSHAREVFDFMVSHMKGLLKRLPKTIKACEELQRLVAIWNADKSKQILLKWEEFCEGLCKEVKELNDVDHELMKRKREFVAICLNDGGHIIYNEKGVVITNPHWFCHDIVGKFLYECTNVECKLERVSGNGIISMEHMKRLILELVDHEGDMEKQFQDILHIMMKLHICYKHDANSILIPSTLKEKHENLSWSTIDISRRWTYVGRRLACQDEIRTMLTLGFFTRLQVSFFQKLESKNDQDTYQVFQDIIMFISNGIEVILQFHHGDIDILLRSHLCQDKMLEFLDNGIVMHIKHLQEDPTLGCLGVHLIEYILRPACVQKLVCAKNRKNQCVQMKDLEAKVMIQGAVATYNWQSCEDLNIGYDTVSSLLGDLAWKNLLEKRSRDLQAYQNTIQALGTTTQDDLSNVKDEKRGSWTSSIWKMPQKLLYGPLVEEIVDFRKEAREYHKEAMSKLDDVVRLIKNLEHNIQEMQGELLHEVCSKIDDVMKLSLEMQKSQLPKLAYLSKFGEKQLLTRFVPGLDRIQLHLMCESIYGFHEVPNQEGCVVYFGKEQTRTFLAMVVWGLKIATLLTKIGAHVACGMGSMVPDLAALLVDTPGLLDYQIPSATLESLPSDVQQYARISSGNQSEAQRWLQGFLKDLIRKENFYKQFNLRKVRYMRGKGSIAWICEECITKQRNDIDELK